MNNLKELHYNVRTSKDLDNLINDFKAKGIKKLEGEIFFSGVFEAEEEVIFDCSKLVYFESIDTITFGYNCEYIKNVNELKKIKVNTIIFADKINDFNRIEIKDNCDIEFKCNSLILTRDLKFSGKIILPSEMEKLNIYYCNLEELNIQLPKKVSQFFRFPIYDSKYFDSIFNIVKNGSENLKISFDSYILFEEEEKIIQDRFKNIIINSKSKNITIISLPFRKKFDLFELIDILNVSKERNIVIDTKETDIFNIQYENGKKFLESFLKYRKNGNKLTIIKYRDTSRQMQEVLDKVTKNIPQIRGIYNDKTLSTIYDFNNPDIINNMGKSIKEIQDAENKKMKEIEESNKKEIEKLKKVIQNNKGKYIRYYEENDWEGETWFAYLKIDDNLLLFQELFFLLGNENITYGIDIDKMFTENEAKVLINKSDSGYMPFHQGLYSINEKIKNEITKVKTIKEEEKDKYCDDNFYKMGILGCDFLSKQ